MRWLRFFKRARRDEEIATEIASYLAIETDENIARGMSPQAAHDAAARKFGNQARVREDVYLHNSLNPFDTIWQDVRYAGRLLKRDRGFAIAAILSLALGIGANSSIFQLLNAVRLRTLPVESPHQLVAIHFPKGSKLSGNFSSRFPFLSYAELEQLRAHDLSDLFTGTFAWSSGDLNTASGGVPQNVEAIWASGEMFEVLGIHPVLGRLIEPADDVKGCGSPPAVISYAYWQRAFAGAPSVLQQTVRLEGHLFDIVGVTPPDFFGLDVGRRFDVAVPVCADSMLSTSRRLERRSTWWLSEVGRLRPGHTVTEVTERLSAISPGIMDATVPEWYTAENAQKYRANKLVARPLESGVSDVREQFGESLVVLLAATGLVLLIACANLANLLLARATARQKEIAVRLAIGASRRRIVGQLLVESLMLAAIGTVLAVGVARGLTAILVAQLAAGMSSLFLDLSWNLPVFAFTAGVAAVACLLFGLAPALKATALSPSMALKAGGRGLTEIRERFGLRRMLVVAQVALSLVLLLGALMFTRTLYNVLTIDAGFNQQVIHVDLRHPSFRSDDPAKQLMTRTDMQARLAAIPGVAGVTLASNAPLGNSWWNEHVFTDASKDKTLTDYTIVGDNYFEVLGVPILSGRAFNATDTLGSPPVAVVNESFVRKAIPNTDPIGHLLWVEQSDNQAIKKVQIVGVARDTKYGDIHDNFEPIVHLAASQDGEPKYSMRLIIKPRDGIAGLFPQITRRVADVNPEISVELRFLSQAVRDGLVRERLMAALSAAFGLLAGLLAAVGLYGVMSYTVSRRSNELGIRLALGAGRSLVLGMVLREAGVLIAVGLVVGTALGLGASNLARSLLFGLQPWDPATVAAALAVLATIGLAASYLPARRASRLDPVRVLRDE
jgi:putative ABC transport system permease protein